MSKLLYRLGRSAAGHPWRMLLAWVVIALVALGLNKAVGDEVKDNMRVPGTESQTAADLLDARFPAWGGASGQVVFAARDGDLTDAADRAAITATLSAIASGDTVVAVTDPFDPAAPSVNADGTVAYSIVRYSVDQAGEVEASAALDAIEIARNAGVDAELSRSIVNAGQKAEGKEAVGLVIALAVLLLAFGSLIAAAIPIGTALFGLFIGITLIGVMAGITDVSSVSITVASMIGLGVGIDYALFVVTRHRGFLREGHSPVEAAGLANATSGSAVLFAGTTVVIALAGLRVAGIPTITNMGLASALVVVLAMIAAVTLLPALLGLAGSNIDRFHVGRRRPKNRVDAKASTETTAPATWAARLAHVVSERPWKFLLVSLAVLLALAAPLLSMRTGVADEGNADPSLTYRKAYDIIADGFGEGFAGPLTIVVDSGNAAADAERVRAALTGVDGVAYVSEPAVNGAGNAAVITAIPTTSPQDEATTALVHHLRNDVLPSATAGSTANAYITGQTAASIDISERLSSRLPLFIGTVILLSFILLMIVFRSVLVPLKAAIMNLLSIGAAYGVVVAVFQWGWGNSLLGLSETVPISPFLPMIMFAILFGLSMDYEVFLLSRVREEFHRTGDSRRSVVDGISSTAKVITSAALIMISVFASFLLIPDVEIKMFAVGLTVAVLVDATIVRMVLVPATMELMGDANWWLPRWLDRLLPTIDIEGTATVSAHEVAVIVDEAAVETEEHEDERELQPA